MFQTSFARKAAYLWLPLLLITLIAVWLFASGGGRSASASGKQPLSGQAPDSVTAAFHSDFETGTNLDDNDFNAYVHICDGGGTCVWQLVAQGSNHVAFVQDQANIQDSRMQMETGVVVPPNVTTATLTFRHQYSFEAPNFDGGVLEASTDGGHNFVDAGANITSGGYNGTIGSGYGNPLADRQGWVGTNGSSFTDVVVNLMPYAGHAVSFRWRIGTDSSNGAPGWAVDDVLATFQAPLPCGPATWVEPAPYPVAAFSQAATSQGGHIYSFGGGVIGDDIANAYRYDPATNSWSTLAPLPAAHDTAGAVGDGTYIYIVGGRTTAGYSNTLYRYDPATNSYFTLAPAPDAGGSAAAYLSGKIYYPAINGNLDIYTIATNSWTEGAALPVPQYAQPSFVGLGAYLYIAGGYSSTESPLTSTFRYDPSTNIWADAPIANMPEARYGIEAGAVLNGRWIIAGGSQSYDSAIAWDPTTNSWSSLEQLPRWSDAYPSAVIGSSFYLLGSENPNGPSDGVVLQYNEPLCSTPSPSPTRTATRLPSPIATSTATPPAGTCRVQFTDVPQGSTFYSYVMCLACRNIISGYICGGVGEPCDPQHDPYFRPGASITRGQAAKIISNSAGYSDQIPPSRQTFQDVPVGSTFWLWVERVALHGAINGYTCGGVGEPCPGTYFRPGNNVTRGQLAKIDANVAGYQDTIPPNRQSFNDVPATNGFWLYIERVYLHSVISGYTCGGVGEPCPGAYFRPGNIVTRGQASKIVTNTFFPNCQGLAVPGPK